MKRILLPTDFSNNSMNAIHYAMNFFQYEPCEFFIINVQRTSTLITDDLMLASPSDTIYNTLISSTKERLSNLINDIEGEYANTLHKFHSNVDFDSFIDAINQIVELERIDLIVMGTRGDSKLDKRLFGSNTIHVIQRGTCPVLVIPQEYKFTAIKEVVFPSNYYTAYNVEDISVLIGIAEKYNFTIHVIHVKDSDHLTEYQENNRAFLDSCFTNINHSFIELDEGKLYKAISDYIVDNNIDLLSIMSRKHSFLERLFTRHPIESFAFDLKVPMLVMENKGEFSLK